MPRTSFELQVPGPPERAVSVAAKALVVAGYLDESVAPAQALLVRTDSVRAGPMDVFHTVRVSGTSVDGNTRLTVEVDAPIGTSAGKFEHIRLAVESVLRRRFFEDSPFHVGRVSDDGTHVILERPVPGVTFDFVRNEVSENSRGLRVLFLGAGAMFYGIAAVYLWDVLVRAPEPFNPVILGSFLVIGSLGVGPFVYALVSPRFPRAVLPSPRGIALRYRGGRTKTIPWDRFVGLRSDPFDPAAQKLLWVDERGRTRKCKVGGAAANTVESVHEVMRQAREMGMGAFEAFNIAPPRTRVLVSPRFLTKLEADFRKVSRRFLPSGRLGVPIYVTNEEDTALVSQYLTTRRVDLAGLKAIGAVAVDHGLWDFGVAVFRLAREHAPEDVGIGRDLAGCLLRTKRQEEALGIVDDLLARGESASLHAMRAAALMEMGHVEDALHSVGKAVEAEPDNLEALNMWFDLVASQGGLPEAIAELDYLASQRPTAWGPNLVLGFRLLEGGRVDEAADRMRRAFSVVHNEHTLYGLTSSLLQQGKVGDVVSLVEEARRSGPVAPGPELNLARAYAVRGESEAALEVLDRIDPVIPPDLRSATNRLRSEIHGRA